MTPQKTKAFDIAPPILGAHFSIAGGLHKALYTARNYACNTAQIFTKNASTWKERTLSAEEIQQFEAAKSETGIEQIAAHTAYLINIASPDPHKHKLSCDALVEELLRAANLGIPYVVMHPGAHLGSGEVAGIDRIALSINRILAGLPAVNTRLLLENTAGQGSSIGYRLQHLAALLDRIEASDRVGICLDTAHLFAAGYDIRDARTYKQTLDRFEKTVGLNHLYLLHLNDSKKELGSRVDRHEHIGRGRIGLTAFACFMNDVRLRFVPKIIETPKLHKGKDWNRRNLNCLRALVDRPHRDDTPI
jgi:deoxyribonuclease-4